MLLVLRQRNYALLWVGGLLSGLGGTVLYTALPFYVYQRTGSALASGAIFIIQLLPGLLFGSVAGVFVDRWDRRRTMIVADLVRAGLIVLLLGVHGARALWLVYAVALLEQFFSLFFEPARGALVPRLVGEDNLVAANSLGSIGFNIIRLAGPAAGGAVLGLAGLPIAVVLDSVSYLCSAVLILLIHVPPQERSVAESAALAAAGRWTAFWRDWLDGLQLMIHDRALLALVGVSGLALFADSSFLVLLVPFVRTVLQQDALVFGWMQAAIALGSLAAGLVIAARGAALPPQRLLALSLGGMGVVTLLLANSRTLWFILVVEALLGVPVTGWLVSQQTLLQSAVADQYRGRVLGAFGTTSTLLLLAGMAAASLLAGPLGVVRTFDGAAALFLVAMAGGLALLRVPTSTRYAA